MKHSEIIGKIAKLTGKTPKQKELAEIINKPVNTISARASRDLKYSFDEVKKIENFYNCDLSQNDYIEQLSNEYAYNKIKQLKNGNCVQVIYRPEVYLSAGYGIEIYDEHKEYMCLDERLFFTDRGTKINPANCEIVTISGNSMSPEYRHGDRVILDKSETHFIDGHIFAFRFNGECFIKEICIAGKRIKAIPLNKDYEPFWIEPEDEVTIFGRIIPRVRL